MLDLFGLSAEAMLGKNFADLGYPPDLAERLNDHIDRVLADGIVVEDEVFYQSPTGYAAHFAYRWGPVRGADGSVEFVVGVSRDTSERHVMEEELRTSEARLRAATELVGVAIYSWNPANGELQWDDRLRAMWGLPPDLKVTNEVFEAGIHPEDLLRVRNSIAECADPEGDGRYNIEYRVVGRTDRITRSIATAGQTSFVEGSPVSFIGAAIDVTAQRAKEAEVRTSEALFRGFAENSSNLIWVGDPVHDAIIYRSAAFERIWGIARSDAPFAMAEWMDNVHPDDRLQVRHALESVKAGETARFAFRIVRPGDGAVRTLRDTCFPIFDDQGGVARIGGITEDLTSDDQRQAYIVCNKASEARRLAAMVRAGGYKVRTFASGADFLDIAPVLNAGCVLVDLRQSRAEGLSVPRELRSKMISLPTIALDAPGKDVRLGVAAMKAGAMDYLVVDKEPGFSSALAAAMAESAGALRPATHDESAGARVAKLTAREREVLTGLVEGGTNKTIGQKLGISPRTVELHRAQVMSRLNARSLTELLQVALAAGVSPLPASRTTLPSA